MLFLVYCSDASLFIVDAGIIELRIASPDEEMAFHWVDGSKAARSPDTLFTMHTFKGQLHSITICLPAHILARCLNSRPLLLWELFHEEIYKFCL